MGSRPHLVFGIAAAACMACPQRAEEGTGKVAPAEEQGKSDAVEPVGDAGGAGVDEGEATPAYEFAGAFEDQAEGAAPTGFSTGHNGIGSPCRWNVVERTDAPFGSLVVIQEDNQAPKTRFCALAQDELSHTDIEASVSCRPISGELDQSCGLAFRYSDQDNYYVARANAREQNVRLYKVVGGLRSPLGEWAGETPAGKWNSLAVRATGKRHEVRWNGELVLEIDDETFPGAGTVGLWTKGDAITEFDGLKVKNLDREPTP